MSKIHRTLKPETKPHDKKRVELVEHFHYRCPKSGIETFTHAEFLFDGMSMPRLLWSLLGSPFLPRNIGPALVHDNLYRFGTDMQGNKITRAQADHVLDYALKINSASKAKRLMVYSGLRTGGWLSWNKHRKNDKKRFFTTNKGAI